jgi:hypothetical protein
MPNIRAARRQEQIDVDIMDLKMRIQASFDRNEDMINLIKLIDRRIYKDDKYMSLPQKYQLLIKGYIDAWWDMRRSGLAKP